MSALRCAVRRLTRRCKPTLGVSVLSFGRGASASVASIHRRALSPGRLSGPLFYRALASRSSPALWSPAQPPPVERGVVLALSRGGVGGRLFGLAPSVYTARYTGRGARRAVEPAAAGRQRAPAHLLRARGGVPCASARRTARCPLRLSGPLLGSTRLMLDDIDPDLRPYLLPFIEWVLDDWTECAFLCGPMLGPGHDPSEVKALALAVLRDTFDRGWVVAGHIPKGGRFEMWPGAPSDWLARIEAMWPQDRAPHLGELPAWFSLAPASLPSLTFLMEQEYDRRAA